MEDPTITILILILPFFIRFTFMAFKGNLQCYLGHKYERTGGSSTAASYCIKYTCKRCGTKREESDSMFG